jgi:DNA-binding MarR family transcriptional regulator
MNFNEKKIISISEIIRDFDMLIQSTNIIVRRLESIGHVEIVKNKKDKSISDIKITSYGWERFDTFCDSQMKTLNRVINQIDSSERELPGATVHNVALILAWGSQKAARKESDSGSELSVEYLL